MTGERLRDVLSHLLSGQRLDVWRILDRLVVGRWHGCRCDNGGRPALNDGEDPGLRVIALHSAKGQKSTERVEQILVECVTWDVCRHPLDGTAMPEILA